MSAEELRLVRRIVELEAENANLRLLHSNECKETARLREIIRTYAKRDMKKGGATEATATL